MNTVGLTMPYIICIASRSFMLFPFASHAFLCIAMSFAISKIKANRCYLVSLSPAFSGLLIIDERYLQTAWILFPSFVWIVN